MVRELLDARRDVLERDDLADRPRQVETAARHQFGEGFDVDVLVPQMAEYLLLRQRLRRSHTVCHLRGGRWRWTCVTATRITVRWCGFDRVPHRRSWCRNISVRSHPRPRCHGEQAAADPAMPRPSRGGTAFVAAPAHRRVLGDPDRGHLPPPPGHLVFAEQCAFGQVHPRDMVPVAADPATRTPRSVIAAGACQWSPRPQPCRCARPRRRSTPRQRGWPPDRTERCPGCGSVPRPAPRCTRPTRRQLRHAKQGLPADGTTRSPSVQPVAPAPTFAMVPDASWPWVTSGSSAGNVPSIKLRSE